MLDNWPRNGDLKEWMRCMIDQCRAIKKVADGASEAHLPIETLAVAGEPTEARAQVEWFLEALPAKEVVGIVRMAKLGAQLCLEHDDQEGVERFLAIAEGVEKDLDEEDKGFAIDSVREFRADQGLVEPADCETDEERRELRYTRAVWSLYRRVSKEDAAGVAEALAEAHAAAVDLMADSEFFGQMRMQQVIRFVGLLGEPGEVRRCLESLNPDDRERVMDRAMKAKLGMKTEAVAQAKEDAAEELRKLSDDAELNLHSSTRRLRDAIEFLVEEGEKASAQELFGQAVKEMSNWSAIPFGWMTSAVYRDLAEMASLVGERGGAKYFLNQATVEGEVEEDHEFSQYALGETIELESRVGDFEKALAKARKIRSATERRARLCELLARSERWEELSEVLQSAGSPKEASELCWKIKFQLPEGDKALSLGAPAALNRMTGVY